MKRHRWWVRRLFSRPVPAHRRAHALRVEGLEPRVVPALFGGGVFTALGDLNADGYTDLVTAAGPGGGPHVEVFSGRDGSLLRSFYPYDPAFGGGVSVAAGDVNGDGAADVVTGTGPGGGPHVEVFSGKDGSLLRSFYAYDQAFRGGVAVAVGDVTGDGTPDVVTAAGPGGGPHVEVFDGKTGALVRSFYAYDQAFRGGVAVAVGDVTGDGTPDVVTAAGPGGGPHVEVFDGKTGARVRSFLAYDPAFTGGVEVAAGDVNGDGDADVVTGTGPGGGPHVEVFSGKDGSLLRSFFAYDTAFRGGVHVSAGDVDGDGRADFATGAGPGGGPHVKILGGAALTQYASFFAFPPGNGPGAFARPAPPTSPPPVSTGNFGAGTSFLYTGTNPVQTGVTPGTIDPVRAAVLRGTVDGTDGQPLAGVTVTVLDHPELGRTVTRSDGTFDLAVNGGGLLAIVFAKDGYLTVQRQTDVAWQDYTLLPTVALTLLDGRMTAIDLTSSAPTQVAQGSVVSDADGSRQATLLFPQGERATMTLPDGSTQPLTALAVRATEYTVGATGPSAMPGTLPASSGYTYAVELSVDQARQAGATQVSFSTAVPFYVQNFLNFPVGMAVPAGYYDRQRGLWVPSDNGRVIKVLAAANGQANLDTDGDGNPDTPAALAALGITDAERTALVALYQPGQTLWRVPVTHFTPWDCNWPYGPPAGATGPNIDPNSLNDGTVDDQNVACGGSVIGIENQTLGEIVSVAGTPFSLVYQSSRVAGGAGDGKLTIPLTGQTTPPNLKRIDLTIDVAGRQFTQSFSPAPNLGTAFTWDGLDGYGRTLEGAQQATVTVGYIYDAVYQTPAQLAQSFAAISGVPIAGNRARQEVTLSQTLTPMVQGHGTTTAAIGGWALDVHHSYDPVSHVLHLGDGQDRGVDNTLAFDVVRVAGSPGNFSLGDGGQARSAALKAADGVAVGPDGSLYIADWDDQRVRRVDPRGVITTVAGNGTPGFSGDGGPATKAELNRPSDIAVGPDGSLYIADSFNLRVRRVDPRGVITTVAGNGTLGFSGDGGPATQAALGNNRGGFVAVGPDSSLYISDNGNERIRRVDPRGVITTIAGNGTPGSRGDGGPATQAELSTPLGISLDPDGSVYFVDLGSNSVRRVGSDGIIQTVAGKGTQGFSGDGGPATKAQLSLPGDVAVGPDGSLYIADGQSSIIRKVGPDGIITTAVGSFGGDSLSDDPDGIPATQAHVSPLGIAVSPDSRLYFSEGNRVRSSNHSLPGFHAGDFAIPSADGSELYQFDPTGRHLRTLNALTGTVIYSFAYDTLGRLTSVTDGDNNITSIVRDAAGRPTAIVGPFGQQTSLTVNTDGYITSIKDPANQTAAIGYGTGGQLTSFTDPLGHRSDMTYDSSGRLINDHDAANGSTTLARQELGGGSYKVTTTNAVNGTRQYLVEKLTDGSVRRTAIDGRGFATVTLIGQDGSRTTTLPDGTKTTVILGPDPRFGMLAPIATSQTVVLPSGLTSTTTASRTATFKTPNDPTSGLVSLTDTAVVNGKTFTSVFDAAARTFTATTAEGRKSTNTLDARGRVVQEDVPGITSTRFSYDARGRLAAVTQGDRTVTYAYDDRGNLSSITDPLSRTTGLAYDAAGRLVRQTQPDGSIITFRFDAAGNMVGLTPPGRPEHTFAYDSHDQLVASTPPAVGAADDTTRYTYNLAHQVVTTSLPGGVDIAYAYCECGRLTSIAAPWGTYTYTYSDTTGELSSLQSPGGFTLSFGRDGALDTSETLSGPVSGSVSWTYNSNFQVTSESVDGANPISFGYDHDGFLTAAGSLTIARDQASGRVTGTTLGTVADTVGYDEFGDVSSYQATVGGTAGLQDTYTRDALGRITRKVETVGGVTTTTDYGYDLKSQLTTVTENGVVVQTYAYDANGDRLSLTTPTGVVSGTYDAQDRLLTYGTKSYAYARDGSLAAVTDSATGQTTHYTYDAFGNLTRVDLPDGRVVTYLIDGENRRVGKQVNGVLTQGLLYDGQLTPVATLDASGAVVERFVYATGVNVPAYIVKGGVTYRLVTDNLGSVRLVVNVASGTIAQRLDYDAFGRMMTDTNPGFQPFGYAGGLYDPDTGLVRFGARDYDAEAGRWTAKDPISFAGKQSNLYTYSAGSPNNFYDPLGTDRFQINSKYDPTNQAEWVSRWKQYATASLDWASNPNNIHQLTPEGVDMKLVEQWNRIQNLAKNGLLDPAAVEELRPYFGRAIDTWEKAAARRAAQTGFACAGFMVDIVAIPIALLDAMGGFFPEPAY